MRPYKRIALLALIALLQSLTPAAAEDFYKGKTLTIVVGFPPGGGFDANARLLSRHVARYIPGSPSVIVLNAPGAGSLTSVLRLDVNLPIDGTVIDAFNFGLIGDSLLRPEETKVDFRNYAWIGSISEDVSTCYLWREGGPKSIAELKAGGHYRFGGAAVGTSDDINTRILQHIFGVDLAEIFGYAGSGDIRLAIERGELDGDCGTWSSVPEEWTKSPKLHLMLRTRASAPEALKSVPYVLDIAPDEHARQIMRFLLADGALGRPYIVSRAVPEDRVQILRTAFAAAVQDPEFVAEAEKLRLPVSPKTGAEAEAIIKGLYATPSDIIAAARKLTAEK